MTNTVDNKALAEEYLALVEADNIDEAKALLIKNFGVEGSEEELNLEALGAFHKEVEAMAKDKVAEEATENKAEETTTEEATNDTAEVEVQEATTEG